MTTSTLATMEWAMWRMAASGEQVLHFQPSTDEMAQLEEKHVEAVRYVCTCYQAGDASVCLSVCLQKNASVELKLTRCNSQMFIINTVSTCFGHHYAHLQESKDRVLLNVVYCAPHSVTHGLCSPEDGHNDARNMLRQC